MPRLSIDGRPVEAPEDATVLDAAEALGIEIPTLCFLRGCQPPATCQVCIVRNRATGQLVPACATKAVAGMDLESETEFVHQVRRTALELLLSDHVGDCLAPCHFACPARMDIPLALRQIGDGELRGAIATIKRNIALPAVLGRICSQPCERGCRRKPADGPVSICELNRYTADQDLASASPYSPDCQPPTGKRVAIVGAGPTGLSAAYYLRQDGHACILFDDQPAPGGRLRRETSEEELPRSVLDEEIRQILRLGVELRGNHRIENRSSLDELCKTFDAVLLAWGEAPLESLAAWGLKTTRRGLDANPDSCRTEQQGLFAAGSAVRGKSPVVRSTGDGKEAAVCISQYLRGEPVQKPGRPFSSHMGRVDSDEMQTFLAASGDSARAAPQLAGQYTALEASDQSRRCLACGCTAHGKCRLERYAELYGADASRFGGRSRPYEVIGRQGSVVFEPGKCIKCGLCVQIAAKAQEPLGLTFVGRGFDVRLAVPFEGGVDDALTKTAAECVAACPTGALFFADRRAACPGGKSRCGRCG